MRKIIFPILLVLFVSCKNEPPAHLTEAFYGTVKDEVYINEFFGFRFPINNWDTLKPGELGSKERSIELLKEASKYTKRTKSSTKKHAHEYSLFSVRKKNPEDSWIRIFSFYAVEEEAFPSVNNSKEFHKDFGAFQKETFADSDYLNLIKLDFKDRMISNQEFSQFYCLSKRKANSKDAFMSQTNCFTRKIKGYYFSISYNSPEGEKFSDEMETLLSSIEWVQ